MRDGRPGRDRDGRDGAAGAQGMARAYALLLVLTFGLIVLGALVRAHEAGLACPDWPLCFGALVPRMNLEVAFEWTHRLVAGAVSLLYGTLAVIVWRRPALRRAAGGLVLLGLVVLGIQVLLGALTVWKLLAAWTVTSHLVTGNTFAVVLLWIAVRLREVSGAPRPRLPLPAAARVVVGLAAVLMAVQLVLGGLVSSTFAGLACPEWPTCNGGRWFPSLQGAVGLHLAHRTGAYALTVTLAVAAWMSRRDATLAPLCRLALALVLAQVAVGVANVRLGLPVEVTGLHSALAAALVLTISLQVRQAWHRPGADGAPAVAGLARAG